MNENRPVNRNTDCVVGVPSCVTSNGQLADGDLDQR